MTAKADLIPPNILLGSTSLAPGASLSVNWLLLNEGAGAANASTTEVRITSSPTSYGHPSDNQAAVSTPALGAGASSSQSTTRTAPTIPGTYYVWVIADNNDQVSQSNIANDEQPSSAFTVVAPITDLVAEDTSTTATLAVGTTTNGTIDASDISGKTPDKDWYKVTLLGGHAYHFAASASASLSSVAFDLRDASSNEVAPFSGTIQPVEGAVPSFDFTAPSGGGTYYLAVSAGGSNFLTETGGYSVTLTDNGVLATGYNAIIVPGGTISQNFGDTIAWGDVALESVRDHWLF